MTNVDDKQFSGYPTETLDSDDDDGTMPSNVAALADEVVGHKIVAAEQQGGGIVLTLDNRTEVQMRSSWDCCAYTELAGFFLDPASVDHIITGVGTTEGYTVWHVYADYGDILKLQVGWSCGNPFYYGYGFDIEVKSL